MDSLMNKENQEASIICSCTIKEFNLDIVYNTIDDNI